MKEDAADPQQPETLELRFQFAAILTLREKYAAAEAEYRRVLALADHLLGPRSLL